MREFTVDRLRVTVLEDRAALGVAAGAHAAAVIRSAQSVKKRVRIVFAAAPSQTETLARLVADSDIDWSRCEAFHMDEYLGLAAGAPQLFSAYLHNQLFSKVPFGAVHLLDGQATDPAEECARYAALLGEAPIDLVCMGIGENGHIAFNDPPVADFTDAATVKVVELEDACRRQQVHDGCFAAIGDVPRAALTLTVPALMRGRVLVAAVPGPSKARAVQATLEGPVTTLCPASILRTHESAALYLDEHSAAMVGRPGAITERGENG